MSESFEILLSKFYCLKLIGTIYPKNYDRLKKGKKRPEHKESVFSDIKILFTDERIGRIWGQEKGHSLLFK